jgi:hypothetical protein
MFDHLPDTARVWIFTADDRLTDPQASVLLADVNAFLTGWTSHGRALAAAATLLHDRFLVVAASIDEEYNAGVSGCGIDAMSRAVETAGEEVGVSWLDGLHVAFRDRAGAVRTVPRSEFRQLGRSGALTADTPVFDTTITSLGVLRVEGLERPAGQSWHAHVFRLGQPA